MIVQIKFRDISFEEAARCLTPEGVRDAIENGRDKTWETERRGQPVKIIVPATIKQWRYFCCSGPHFRVVGFSNRGVCPHIAEIGD